MTLVDPLAGLADRLERSVTITDGSDWARWLAELFPRYCTAPFAPHHAALWRWLWAIEPGTRPNPFVAIWNRGAAKSTTAELGCVALGARGKRRYGLYVCDTQDRADDHVGNIGSMLEARSVEQHYPDMARRLVGKYGSSKGWRRNRLRTATGFTVDAIGLDVAARGVKLDEQRPDFLVIDDVDDTEDTKDATERKIRTLTRSLIPSGAPDLAILAIQNLVHEDSVFARLAGLSETKADFLARRIVSGPIPAVEGFEYSEVDDAWVITAGTPTWAGLDLPSCEAILNDEGPTAFLAERQHEVEPPAGGMFDHIEFRRRDPGEVPWGLVLRTVVWVDPAVTASDSSDSVGIQADCVDIQDVIWRLWSWEGRTTPLDALCRALRKATELGAEAVGVETDQGGDTWRSVYREAVDVVRNGEDELEPLGEEWDPPAFKWAKAGAGHGSKVHRASQMLADYERHGRIVHVEGTHRTLERALRRFPKTKPFDLVDGSYWSWKDLRKGAGTVPLDPDAHRREARKPLGREPVEVPKDESKQVRRPRRRPSTGPPSW